jgi:putative RNA 2'-phosphotransferase
MNVVKQSKFLSLILRHKPETVGLILGSAGWALVSDILTKCDMSMTELEVVVEQNDKKRFEFSEDKTKIRASQGHSVDIDLDYVSTVPPKHLFHGTTNKAIFQILMHGIKKMQRHHVHMSSDRETAITVGRRKGDPYVLTVKSQEMYLDGYKFYQSTNGVWLTDYVPEKYLEKVDLKQYYHDIHCNAIRHEPMGCPGCSCYMNQKLLAAKLRIKELEKEIEEGK